MSESWKLIELDEPHPIPRTGLRVCVRPYGEDGEEVLDPDAADFAKYLRETDSSLAVELPDARSLALHSDEIWMPLVLLAQEIPVQIFLEMVAGYVADRLRGVLRRDKAQVSFSVEFSDAETGQRNHLQFKGDPESFDRLLKRFKVKQLRP